MKYEYKISKESQVLKTYKGKISFIDSDVEKRLETYKEKIKIDGFRPGKVPLEKVKEMYFNSAFFDVLQENLSAIVKEIFAANKYDVFDSPRFEPKSEIVPGKDVEFSLHFDTHPQVANVPLEKLSIEKPECEINDKEIVNEIKRVSVLKNELLESTDDKYQSKIGDVVNIDFKGFVDDVAFDGGEAKSHDLELGSGSFIDGFETQLVGKKKGDKVKVKVKFPKRYQSLALRGREAMFECTVNSIKKRPDVVVNDELAKKMDFETLVDFKAAIEKNLKKIVKSKVNSVFRENCNNEIVDNNKTEVSETLIKKEIDGQIENLKKKQTITEKEEKKIRENLEKDIFNRIKLSYIFQAIIKENSIKVEDNDVRDYVVNEAGIEDNEANKTMIESYVTNQQIRSSINGYLIEEKVYKFIEGKAKIKVKKCTIDDVDNLIKKINN